jgi:outer membrane receptor protein involved in Fe transport
VQLRNDNIGKAGLYHTEARQFLGTVREDSVIETSAGAYVQNETVWTAWLRSIAGLRVDGYRFDVRAGDPANGGVARDAIASPKGGIVIGLWRGTEFYGNAGLGFHSNDARGTTISVDPLSGAPANRVTPLVRAHGAEAGVRTVAIPRLHTSATFWTLDLESELLFVGDAGTTEANRPSHRHGLELTNYFRPRSWLTVDGDISWSSSRFTDEDPAGRRIPGSVETVVSLGATVEGVRNLFGSARLRYFGPRPLIEDDSVRSHATSLINVEGGYRINRRARLAVEVFNLLNTSDSDIDYFYTSRLADEPAAGYDDIHLHPALPRTARVSLRLGF